MINSYLVLGLLCLELGLDVDQGVVLLAGQADGDFLVVGHYYYYVEDGECSFNNEEELIFTDG